MRTFKLSLAIAILLVLFIFSAYNSQPVQIRFVGLQSGELPLFLLILFSFLLGFMVAALLSTIRGSQMRRQIHLLEKEAVTGRSRDAGTGGGGNGNHKG